MTAKKIKVWVGMIESSGNGLVHDDRTKEVEFFGEELASRTEPGTHNGRLSDTRGVDQVLWRTADGRLFVHEKSWSRWQGESTVYALHRVTPAMLGPTGRFAELGVGTEYERPLTLDEAVVGLLDTVQAAA